MRVSLQMALCILCVLPLHALQTGRIARKAPDRVLWGYGHTEAEYKEALAKFKSSPLGKGRLWITGSKITHDGDTADDKTGKIEWMDFAVEIKLPK